MTTTTTSAPILPLTWLEARSAVVLVATDGTAQSDGALRVAMERARERHSRLEVLTVLPAEPPVVPDVSFTVWGEASRVRREALLTMVQEQVKRISGDDTPCPVTLLDGNPAFSIARIAAERHAALVVVGLGRHAVRDRLFSDETALQLARISRVPVLAVPAGASRPPEHAVVAVDFSEISARAVQAAVEAVSDEGRVDLVHAMPYVQEGAFSPEFKEPYQQWAEVELEALAKAIVAPHGVRITTAAVRGRPAVALLTYASDVGADLIVTGTHGRGFVSRTLMGSVTTQLVRGASCSVLTVPRDPLPAVTSRLQLAGNAGAALERDWAVLLSDFTDRNVGRRTVLEVDDLEIGAQAQEHNYPLIAAMYDPRAHRVQILLGDNTVEGRHLTRSIGMVSGVGLLNDGRGHDTALRIEHGQSHTLLTFASGAPRARPRAEARQ